MVARGRCQEGRFRGGNERGEGLQAAGAKGEAESPGSPLTHPDTRAYTRERTLRFLPHILNEHTATDTRPADRRTVDSLVVYFLFLFYLSLFLSLSLSGERNNLSASAHFGDTPSFFREPPSLRLSPRSARGAKAELNWIFPGIISVLFYSRKR